MFTVTEYLNTMKEKTTTANVTSHIIRNNKVRIHWKYEDNGDVTAELYYYVARRKGDIKVTISNIEFNSKENKVTAVIKNRTGPTTRTMNCVDLESAVRVSLDEFFLGKHCNEADYTIIEYGE